MSGLSGVMWVNNGGLNGVFLSKKIFLMWI